MSTGLINRLRHSRGHDDRKPPKARLVLRIGVTGHRLNKLSADDPGSLAPVVRDGIEAVVKCLREHHGSHPELFSPAAPVVRVVSPLAEGADQIVANAGLELGCELHAVLPFERGDYLTTFSEMAREGSPSSVEEFDRLLQRASAVFTLDGSLDNPGRAFEFLGKVLINEVDVLIAIWDGQAAAGPGGTEQVVRDALARGVAVVWLNPSTPGERRLLSTLADLDQPQRSETDLCRIVNELLRPPPTTWHEHEAAAAEGRKHDRSTTFHDDYLKESQPNRDFLGLYWAAFRDLLNDEPVSMNSEVEDFVIKTGREWRRELEEFEAGSSPSNGAAANELVHEVRRIDEVLLPHYAWANELALYYGNRYRSAFLLNYLLAAMAVVLCLLIVAFGWTEHGKESGAWAGPVKIVLAVGECLCIGLIALNTYRGKLGRWHERWIDYRLLAEGLRQFRALAPFGGGSLLPPVPEHLARYGDPRSTWMSWHLRNVARETGLPNWRLAPARIDAYRDYFTANVIQDQIQYYGKTVRRLETVRHKLHQFGDGLFLFTGVVCVLHLTAAVGSWTPAPVLENWMTALLAILPAIGAALFGIRSQGEFQRVTKRSTAMQEELSRYGQGFSRLRTAGADAGTTLQYATACSQLMVREVLDWRIVFVDRPLNLPS
jgi:hypothetical protein